MTKKLMILLLSLALIPYLAIAEDLKKLSLDDAASLGTTIETDAKVKVEGKASIKITTQNPTTICLGEVSSLDVDNTRLLYKAQVKSDIKGSAFLEMWVTVAGKKYFSRAMTNAALDKSDWKSIHAPFMLKKGEVATKATLNLVINGTGTVWVDDVVLSKTPLK